MTPEEYQRIKEAEKEHLRALKKLKQTAHLLQRRKSVNQALENMVSGSEDAFDTHQEMLDKLTIETARQEARLEIALENAALEDESKPADQQASLPVAPIRSPEELDEELLKERAKTLIRQMKIQMGNPASSVAETPPPSDRRTDPASPEKPDTPPPADRPEKTIGRMKK
ncbi:MAG: hypothetical protein ACE5G0_12390 [Rhodothermales bacterium]